MQFPSDESLGYFRLSLWDIKSLNTDVLLVIEVADSTVESNRAQKIPLYAKASIAEAWIINLPDETIELYAEAEDGTYRVSRNFKRGEAAQAHSLTDLVINTTELFT